METPIHTINNLFAQLGLPSDTAAIDNFIAAHAPLASDIQLADAPFWSDAQATFLREEIREDADWAEVVDQLDARAAAEFARSGGRGGSSSTIQRTHWPHALRTPRGVPCQGPSVHRPLAASSSTNT